MSTPFEVVAGPLELWLAPVGTAFPALNAAPGVGWVKIGSNGNLNYDEDGVTVTHTQKLDKYTPAGSTIATKVFRTEEEFMIGVKLDDITLEQYLYALNKAIVTTVAAGSGTIGTKKMPIAQGPDVTLYALLARGMVSPYGDLMPGQYEVPRVYQSENPKPVFKKGKPAQLALEFTGLANLSAPATERLGFINHQHQPAI